MKKKVLLILAFIALFILPTSFSGADSILAHDPPHYYAYAHWPTSRAQSVHLIFRHAGDLTSKRPWWDSNPQPTA